MNKNTLIAIVATTLVIIAFSLGISLGNNVMNDDLTSKEKEISVYELLLRTRED